MRSLLATFAIAAVAAAVAPAPASAPVAASTSAQLQTLRSGTLDARGAADARRAAQWGGPIVASTGERVTVFFSPTYPRDAALHQLWAEHLVSLLHGPELTRVEVYVSTLQEIAGFCGRGALACYSPQDEMIVTPGDDVPNGPTVRAVLAHEYGHHVARSRVNPPWDPSNFGSKRWASQVDVCARVRAGDLSASTQGDAYRRNPGEVYAEHYRVLNERRLGLPETPWGVVAPDLYPDERALVQLERDVVAPWRAPARIVRSANLRANGTRTYTIATPLDGNLQVRVRMRPGVRHTVTLRSGNTLLARSGSGVARATVCGERTTTVRLTGPRGSAFTLEITRP